MTEETKSWEKLRSRVVYENSWMTVLEDQVVSPGGNETIYGYLRTPVAVGVMAVTEDHEAVLVGQHRYPVNEYSWEIIEGGAHEGEQPVLTAKREMREEAGIEATSLMPLGNPFHFTNSRSDEVGYLYLATGLSFGESDPDDTEVITLKRLPLDEVYSMVDEGEIRDAMSIIAIDRYRNLFNR